MFMCTVICKGACFSVAFGTGDLYCLHRDLNCGLPQIQTKLDMNLELYLARGVRKFCWC